MDCEGEHEHPPFERWDLSVDVPASDALRSRLQADRSAEGGAPFFHGGPGYARLSGGSTSSPCDRI
jgi:hypothetical protein